ncbi:MAG: DUF4097 family beta strand repeat-containing protein [Pseudomonadota bacterium]
MSKWLEFGVAALIALLMIPLASAKVISEEFRVRSGGELSVVSDIGQISVETSRGNRVEVRVDINEGDPDQLNVTMEQDGNKILVRGKFTENRRWRRLKVKYRITVPDKFNVDLETKGGSIQVNDLTGTVDVSTAGGSLKFGNIVGPLNGRTSGGSITLDGGDGMVTLRTSGGSINVGDVTGDLDLHTSGGSINIGMVEGNVEANTSGGAIHIEEAHGAIDASTSGGSITAYISQQPQADSQLQTSAGTITVYLAEDLRLDLKARTNVGSVKSDFRVNGATKSKRSLSGSINGGGPELYLRSSAGSVKIKKR